MDEVSEEQYARFVSAVNTNFRRFEGLEFAYIAVDELVYFFRIIEFDDYVIVKVELNND